MHCRHGAISHHKSVITRCRTFQCHFSETSPHPVSLMVASWPTLECKHKESSNHDVQSKRSDDRRVVGHRTDPMSEYGHPVPQPHADRMPFLLHLRGFLLPLRLQCLFPHFLCLRFCHSHSYLS